MVSCKQYERHDLTLCSIDGAFTMQNVTSVTTLGKQREPNIIRRHHLNTYTLLKSTQIKLSQPKHSHELYSNLYTPSSDKLQMVEDATK